MTFYQKTPKCLNSQSVLFPLLNPCYVYVSDFVLVWEVKSHRKRRAQCEREPKEDEEQVVQEESRSEKRKAQLARWRDKFIQNLQTTGLLLEKVHHHHIFPQNLYYRPTSMLQNLSGFCVLVLFLLPGRIIQFKKDSTLFEAQCSLGGVGVLCRGIMPQSTTTGQIYCTIPAGFSNLFSPFLIQSTSAESLQ